MYYLKEDQKHEIKNELRGGIGALDFLHIIPPEALQNSGTQFTIATFKPGESIGLHGHKENFEIYHILEGEALVTDNNEEKILTAGDSEVCANGDTHSIKNIGTGELKMLAVILWNPKNHEYKLD